MSESYSVIKTQLISNYGSIDRIVSDIMVGLTAKKRPAPGSKRDRYQFYVDLTKAVSRLDKLCKVWEVDRSIVLPKHHTLPNQFTTRG